MEAMSEILLDRLAQESNLVAYESSDDESLNKPLDETSDEPSDETLDEPLNESYRQSYQAVFWTVLSAPNSTCQQWAIMEPWQHPGSSRRPFITCKNLFPMLMEVHMGDGSKKHKVIRLKALGNQDEGCP
mgnify:CR=1 FL=1